MKKPILVHKDALYELHISSDDVCSGTKLGFYMSNEAHDIQDVALQYCGKEYLGDLYFKVSGEERDNWWTIATIIVMVILFAFYVYAIWKSRKEISILQDKCFQVCAVMIMVFLLLMMSLYTGAVGDEYDNMLGGSDSLVFVRTSLN